MLENMLHEASRWLTELTHKEPARWLTFWGRNTKGNGTGKTHLCRLLHRTAVRRGLVETRVIRGSGGQIIDSFDKCCWLHWPSVTAKMQRRDPDGQSAVYSGTHAALTVIDDIGAEHQTDAMLNSLSTLLAQRVGMWTLITTNLDPNTWRDRDARIASRMTRDGSKCVQSETIDYSLRGDK